LAVLAIQHLRRMQGGAQGQLMLCSDGNVWIVKFLNNPQHRRVLANEYLATKLAAAVGLPVPQVDLVEATEWLLEHSPEMEIDWGKRKERCAVGLQFGSRYAGGMMPGHVVDFLADEQRADLRNKSDFAGILALDKWTCNCNGRQAVYVRKQREVRYRAVFIDFGHCFQADQWVFTDVPLRGVYFSNDVYREITGWESFEPWLSRIEKLPEETVWQIASEVPPQWYGGDQTEMERLIETLLRRRKIVRDLIDGFRNSYREPFPKWGCKGEGMIWGKVVERNGSKIPLRG